MKRIKRVILFMLFVLTLTFIGACKNSSGTSQNGAKPNYVALNVKQYSMIIGDELLLSMDYDLDKNAEFSYSSSNESVATVDEEGKVSAINSGTATITVKYGTASDSCEITVDRGDVLAYLDYEQITTDSLNICLNESLSLQPRVSFNGKYFDDAVVEYVLSNPSVGKVENGVFTGTQIGETEIYVSAVWRGISGETLTKTLSVEVVNDIQIFLNEGVDSSFLLHTLDKEKVSVTVGATENGSPIEDVELELSSGGEKYVEYDGNSLQSKGIAGETTLVARCLDSQGKTWEKTFKVTVTQTVLTYDKTLSGFSALDGDFVGNTSFLKMLGGNVVKAEDMNGDPLVVENGNVYGVETNKKGLTKTKIIVYSARVGYIVNIEGYTGIIDEAEDLKWFGVKNDGYASHPKYNAELDQYDRGYTFLAQKQDGYYVLANNIDASGYVQPNGGDGLTNSINEITKYVSSRGGIGLTGTFDGQGHTIRGLTTQRYGLFGIIFGGTLKNVAFTELNVSADKNGSPIAQWIINGTLDNVYLQVDKMKSETAGALTGCLSGTSMQGCIIEYAEGTGVGEKFGSLTYMAGKERGASGFDLNVFNGVYVVSPMVLTNYYDKARGSYTVDASNMTESKYTYSGIKRYDNQSDFEVAGDNFATFENRYWDKSGATPIWKTKDFIPEDKDDSETIEGGTGIGSFNPDWL